MNELFDWLVDLLIWLAPIFGMTYKEINIWIFVILEPAVFLLMLYIIVLQRRKLRFFKRER